MTGTLAFKLVSPDKVLADMPVRSVQLPASDGDMGVLPDHAPVVTSLRDGTVTVVGTDGRELRFAVQGGFVDVTPTTVTLLADAAQAA